MKNKGLIIIVVTLAIVVSIEAFLIFTNKGFNSGPSSDSGPPIASNNLLSTEQMNLELEQLTKDRETIENLDTTAKRINKDFEEEKITEGQAVLFMLQAGLDPEQLPSQYKAVHDFMPFVRDPLAGAISLANANIAKYEPEIADQIKKLMHARPGSNVQDAKLSASLVQQTRPGGGLETLEDENFVVHYIPGDVQTAQIVLRALQDSFSTAPKYGFPVHVGDDSCPDSGPDGRLDAYLVDEVNAGAVGQFLPCLGTSSGFLKIQSGSEFLTNIIGKNNEDSVLTDYDADYRPADVSFYRMITAHEYFHAVQIAMVGAGSYMTPWVRESSAELFALRLVDQTPFNISSDAGAEYRSLVSGFQSSPQKSLETPLDGALWMDIGAYERLMFMIYAEDRGKLDEVKKLIKAQVTSPIQDIFGGDNAFMRYMGDFAQANFFTYGLQPQQYREATLYPGVLIDTVINEYDVEDQEVGIIKHLASKYVALNITPDIADEPEMEIEFNGDDDGRFLAQVFVMKGNEGEIIPIVLDGAGEGEITVDLDEVTSIFLVGTATTLSPGSYSYTFSARVKRPEQTYQINTSPIIHPALGPVGEAQEYQETWTLKDKKLQPDGSTLVNIEMTNTKGETGTAQSSISANGDIIFESFTGQAEGQTFSCEGPFPAYLSTEGSKSVTITCTIGSIGAFSIDGTLATGPESNYEFDGKTYPARTVTISGLVNGQLINQDLEYIAAPGIGILEINGSLGTLALGQMTGGRGELKADVKQVLIESSTDKFWVPK